MSDDGDLGLRLQDEPPAGFLQDAAGDWSSSRLIAVALGLVFLGMAISMIWLSFSAIDLAHECLPVAQGPQCARDPNVAAVITAIGQIIQWLGISLAPPAAAIIGVMWKRNGE